MALKSVNAPRGYASDLKVKATEIGIGETFSGFLLAIGSRIDKETQREMLSAHFLLQDNTVAFFLPAGNIKYALKDGKLTIGQYTEITRKPDTKVKGMKSSDFDILQDDEKTVNPEEYLKPYVPEQGEGVPDFGGNAAAAPKGKPTTAAQKKTASIIDKIKRLDGSNQGA